MRTVSRDDELIQRGANPRTGVVSPWIPYDADSGGLTDYVSLKTVTHPRSPTGHRSGSGRWKQDGSSWTFVDNWPPNLQTHHNVEGARHCVPSEVHEAGPMYQIPLARSPELDRSAVRIEKLHKGIGHTTSTQSSLGTLLDAKDLPGGSQRSPTLLSSFSRGNEHILQSGLPPQDSSNDGVGVEGQLKAYPKVPAMSRGIRETSVKAHGFKACNPHLEPRIATSCSSLSAAVPTQVTNFARPLYLEGGGTGQIGMSCDDHNTHSRTLRYRSEKKVPSASTNHLPLSLRSNAEKRQAIIAAGNTQPILTTSIRDARPKMLRRGGTAVMMQDRQHGKDEKSGGRPFVIACNQQARVVADLDAMPDRPPLDKDRDEAKLGAFGCGPYSVAKLCDIVKAYPDDSEAVMKHADHDLHPTVSQGQGSIQADCLSKARPSVDQTLMESDSAAPKYELRASPCSDPKLSERKLRACREVQCGKVALQDARQGQTRAGAQSIKAPQNRQRIPECTIARSDNELLEAGSPGSSSMNAEGTKQVTRLALNGDHRNQNPSSRQVEQSPDEDSVRPSRRHIDFITQAGYRDSPNNGITHLANGHGEQKIPETKNPHSKGAFVQSKQTPSSSEILRKNEGGVFFAGQWIDVSSDTSQASLRPFSSRSPSNRIRSLSKSWSNPVDLPYPSPDTLRNVPNSSLVQQIMWVVVRHVSRSFQVTMPALQVLRSSGAGAMGYLSALRDIGIASIYFLILLNLLLLLRNTLLAMAVLIHWIWNPFSTLVAIIRWCVI